MKKIKIAQIGTSGNSHGSDIWQTVNKMKDIFEVVGYAFPENEREKFPGRTRCFDGYREMTVGEILSNPEIEAVCIETEEIYLTKYALMAAKAGKHIHMEKPGSQNLAEFRELIEVLKENKLAFSIGYMYRFNPKVIEALDAVRSGKLGKIYSVEAQMSCKHDASVREWLKNFKGGMMFFLGCHLVDLIYRIQGDPKEIIPLSTSTGTDGINAEDFGMAVFKYENGVSFAKTCDVERGGVTRRQLVICGDAGTIEIKPLEFTTGDGTLAVSSECYSDGWIAPLTVSNSEVYNRYKAMLRNFAELIQGKENPYSYDYELNLYKLILRACGCEV